MGRAGREPKRSPDYPAVSLRHAEDFLKRIFSDSGGSLVSVEDAVRKMGYASRHGSSDRVLSSLSEWGLLRVERASGTAPARVRLLELGEALLSPPSQAHKVRVLRTALETPQIVQKLLEQHGLNGLRLRGLETRIKRADGRFTDAGKHRCARAVSDSYRYVQSLQDQIACHEGGALLGGEEADSRSAPAGKSDPTITPDTHLRDPLPTAIALPPLECPFAPLVLHFGGRFSASQFAQMKLWLERVAIPHAEMLIVQE